MVSLAYADSAHGPAGLRLPGGWRGLRDRGAGSPAGRRRAARTGSTASSSREWRPDRPLVNPRDTAAIWLVTRTIERSAYADTLYALVRPPGAPGRAGEHAGPPRGTPGRVHRLPRLARARPGADEQRGAAPPRDGARAGAPLAGAGRRGSSAPCGRASRRSPTAAATATAACRSTRPRRSPSRCTSSRPPRPAGPEPSASLLEQYELLVPGTAGDDPLSRPPADLRPPSAPPECSPHGIGRLS